MHKKYIHMTLSLLVVTVLFVGCSKPKEEQNTEQNPEVSTSETPVTQQGNSEMSDTVLVTVNDKTLTRSTASGMVQAIAARQGVPPQMMQTFLQQAGSQLEQQAIAQFIDQTLAQDEVANRNIDVSAAEISNVIAKISGTLPEGTTLEQAMATRGMTMDQLRVDIVDNEKTRKLFEAETEGVAPVTDEQVATFYAENEKYFKKEAEVQASHILIGCKEDASEEDHTEAAAKAEAVRKQLAEGGDFAALAKENSTCPSKEKGGDLGSFGSGRMVPEFEKAAFAQDLDAIGPVIKTPFGYHIIKVTNKTEGTVQPLEEATEQIMEHLANQGRQEKFAKFLKGLRSGAKIAYAEGFAPTE